MEKNLLEFINYILIIYYFLQLLDLLKSDGIFNLLKLRNFIFFLCKK